MREVRTGMPRRNHGPQRDCQGDRTRPYRPLHRLRALRRRMPHRLGDPQRISAADGARRRRRAAAHAGTGAAADPIAAFQPYDHAETYSRRGAATDRRSRTLRPDGLQLAAGLLHARYRPRTVAPYRRFHDRRLRLDGQKADEPCGSDAAQTAAARPLPIRKATALLIIHTPASSRFGCEDANLAYQNASLMAQSLGVSQIYMGFILTAIRMSKKNAFARIAGITGRPQAIMALGIPAFRYPKYTERG